MKLLAIAALVLVPMIAHGQIYKSVDENGNTVYSDKPPSGGGAAESVNLPAINSTPPPPNIPTREKPEPPEEVQQLAVAIVSPVEDTVIPIGAAGNFSVSAELNASLEDGATAQLLMDGVAVGPPQSVLSWSLTNVFRGSHTLTVDILDSAGDSLAVSVPVTVHVRRPSKNF